MTILHDIRLVQGDIQRAWCNLLGHFGKIFSFTKKAIFESLNYRLLKKKSIAQYSPELD